MTHIWANSRRTGVPESAVYYKINLLIGSGQSQHFACLQTCKPNCLLRHVSTFVDAVLRYIDIHPSLNGSALDVLQLLHSLLAHVLQLADMVIHIGDLNFACCPCAPGCHLS